jgi:antitoxin CptB
MELPPRLETIENWRKRLIFRSWHRGTREMDLIMGSFAEQYVPGFEEGELLQYESLLMENDPDVYNWYIGVSPIPANILTPVIEKFLKHKVVSRP